MNDPLQIPDEDDMSYEAAEWNRLRHGMQMSMEEKLDWLEWAYALAKQFDAVPEQGVPDQGAAGEDWSR